MTDPSNAMHSFQEELKSGRIKIQPGDIYPTLYFYGDNIGDRKFRLTYVTLENMIVTAFVNFVLCAPIEKIPCLQIGYAVPEAYRNQNRAKEAIRMAIIEAQHGLKRNAIATFYVEAIIGVHNIASQRVAEKVISDTPMSITDEFSGLPALQYLRKIE